MRRSRLAIAFVATLILASLTPLAHAIDGVTLIDQDTVLAAGGFPYQITQPGSYRLGSNLTVPGGVDGIQITADNATLDLNGFTMIGGGGGTGILLIGGGHNGITVRNGTIANFDTGLDLSLSSGNDVEQINGFQNSNVGISVGVNSTVSRSSGSGNGGVGIKALSGTTLSGNTASGNFGQAGIVAGPNSTVSGNTASGNFGGGIDVTGAESNSTVSGNTASRNGGFGITTGPNSTVSGNTASVNGGNGITVGRASIVSGNTASGNVVGLSVTCPINLVGNTALGNGGANIVQSGFFCTGANNNPSFP